MQLQPILLTTPMNGNLPNSINFVSLAPSPIAKKIPKNALSISLKVNNTELGASRSLLPLK
jgi:hypothetical protein